MILGRNSWTLICEPKFVAPNSWPRIDGRSAMVIPAMALGPHVHNRHGLGMGNTLTSTPVI
jgi:hypothetical protein